MEKVNNQEFSTFNLTQTPNQYFIDYKKKNTTRLFKSLKKFQELEKINEKEFSNKDDKMKLNIEIFKIKNAKDINQEFKKSKFVNKSKKTKDTFIQATRVLSHQTSKSKLSTRINTADTSRRINYCHIKFSDDQLTNESKEKLIIIRKYMLTNYLLEKNSIKKENLKSLTKNFQLDFQTNDEILETVNDFQHGLQKIVKTLVKSVEKKKLQNPKIKVFKEIGINNFFNELLVKIYRKILCIDNNNKIICEDMIMNLIDSEIRDIGFELNKFQSVNQISRNLSNRRVNDLPKIRNELKKEGVEINVESLDLETNINTNQNTDNFNSEFKITQNSFNPHKTSSKELKATNFEAKRKILLEKNHDFNSKSVKLEQKIIENKSRVSIKINEPISKRNSILRKDSFLKREISFGTKNDSKKKFYETEENPKLDSFQNSKFILGSTENRRKNTELSVKNLIVTSDQNEENFENKFSKESKINPEIIKEMLRIKIEEVPSLDFSEDRNFHELEDNLRKETITRKNETIKSLNLSVNSNKKFKDSSNKDLSGKFKENIFINHTKQKSSKFNVSNERKNLASPTQIKNRSSKTQKSVNEKKYESSNSSVISNLSPDYFARHTEDVILKRNTEHIERSISQFKLDSDNLIYISGEKSDIKGTSQNKNSIIENLRSRLSGKATPNGEGANLSSFVQDENDKNDAFQRNINKKLSSKKTLKLVITNKFGDIVGNDSDEKTPKDSNSNNEVREISESSRIMNEVKERYSFVRTEVKKKSRGLDFRIEGNTPDSNEQIKMIELNTIKNKNVNTLKLVPRSGSKILTSSFQLKRKSTIRQSLKTQIISDKEKEELDNLSSLQKMLFEPENIEFEEIDIERKNKEYYETLFGKLDPEELKREEELQMTNIMNNLEFLRKSTEEIIFNATKNTDYEDNDYNKNDDSFEKRINRYLTNLNHQRKMLRENKIIENKENKAVDLKDKFLFHYY